MSLSPVALRAFFEEVLSHLKEKKDSPEAALVSNGNFVFSDNHLFGYAYGHYFQWISQLKGVFQKQLVSRAILHASHSSRKILKEYGQYYNDYQSLLRMRFEEGAWDKEKYNKLRWHMALFMHCLLPMYKKLHEKPERFEKLFKTAFNASIDLKMVEGFEEKGLLWSLPFADRLKWLLQRTFTAFKTLAKAIDSLLGKPVVLPMVEELTFEGKGLEKAVKNYVKAKEHGFQDHGFVQKMGEVGPIVLFESVSEIEFPFEELAKVFFGEEITTDEDEVLGEWIEKLSLWKHPEAAGYFHPALESLYYLLSKTDKAKTNGVVPFEQVEKILLHDRGAEIGHLFTTVDSEQVKWIRKSIAPGKTVHINGVDYRIGEKLTEIEGSSFYRLAGDSRLIRVPQNRCILAQDNFESDDIKKQALEMCFLDPSGKFALLEGIKKPIGKIVWKSEDEMLADEQNLFNSLVGQLKRFVKSKVMPENISTGLFVENEAGVVKSWQILRPSKFNIVRFVLYAKEIANGNAYIFKSLIENSGVERTDFSKFFIEIAKNRLLGQEFDCADLAERYKLGKEYGPIGVDFDHQITYVMKRCLEEAGQITEDQKKKMSNLILRLYKSSRLVYRLPDDAVDVVLKKFKES